MEKQVDVVRIKNGYIVRTISSKRTKQPFPSMDMEQSAFKTLDEALEAVRKYFKR